VSDISWDCFIFQISRDLSDGLQSNDIGRHPRGLVPVSLEDDKDVEEGVQQQIGAYGNGISKLRRKVLVWFLV
jgi:hypothetical protein